MGIGRSLTLLVAVTELAMLGALVAPYVEASPDPAQKGLRTIRLITFTPDPGLLAAQARGYFAAEGLVVEVTETPNSTVQMRGIGEGTWDVASTAFDNVLAWSGREGATIVAVLQPGGGVYLPMWVRPEIQSVEDLRGRRLAADAVDTAFALVLRRILLARDLDMDRGDYELVAEGATPARLESMRRADTFAGILSAELEAAAETAGLRRMAVHTEVLPDYPGGVYAVNRTWAVSHRDDLVRFLRAWLAGARWVKANPDAAIELVIAERGVGRQVAVDAVAQLATGESINVPGLQSVLDLRTQFGFVLPMGTQLAPFYTTEYLTAALGR